MTSSKQTAKKFTICILTNKGINEDNQHSKKKKGWLKQFIRDAI